MQWTAFSPHLDGNADWAFTHSDGLSNRLLKRIFADTCARTLEDLHGSYFNAVETYNLPLRIAAWIDNTPLLIFAQEAGKIYATLDYFTARLPLPRRVKALGARKEANFYQYFCQRSLENIQANSAGLLKSLAISTLIPDKWFPEKELESLIEKEIKRLGIYSSVKVGCELNLAPGGWHWQSNTTMQSVIKIQEKLAIGQPWPLRMIRTSGKLTDNRQVIVYACREQTSGRLRLEIFEPNCILEEHALQVVTSKDSVEVMEIVAPGQHLPVLGLVMEDYSPASPPLECSPWWLRRETLRRARRRGLSWG